MRWLFRDSIDVGGFVILVLCLVVSLADYRTGAHFRATMAGRVITDQRLTNGSVVVSEKWEGIHTVYGEWFFWPSNSWTTQQVGVWRK